MECSATKENCGTCLLRNITRTALKKHVCTGFYGFWHFHTSHTRLYWTKKNHRFCCKFEKIPPADGNMISNFKTPSSNLSILIVDHIHILKQVSECFLTRSATCWMKIFTYSSPTIEKLLKSLPERGYVGAEWSATKQNRGTCVLRNITRTALKKHICTGFYAFWHFHLSHTRLSEQKKSSILL